VSDLKALLVEARDRGFLGGQAIDRQLEHARGFADVCLALLGTDARATDDDPDGGATLRPETRILDLGAGGGLPGLILASTAWPFATRTFLLDGSVRRAEWLQYVVTELGLEATVEVVGERAEVAGRSAILRHQQLVVVARSFGRPAVTAECAAPLLSVGGWLVVSEPPPPSELPADARAARGARAVAERSNDLTARWPHPGVAELGFAAATEWRARGYRYAVLGTECLCAARYPRRNGIPAKRPLF
jgi:16S rRNA (guanine527-N7)-methyltransferase